MQSPGDITILDCLRKADGLTIAQLEEIVGVTATAVRQRLTRLMAEGLVDRVRVSQGRGRPSHRYELTERGRQETGRNFADLAMALWAEVRTIEDPEVRRGLLQRLSSRMAALYASAVEGSDLETRMRAVASLWTSQQIPFEVRVENELPVLTALGCPYTELAEKDRSICAMEKMLFTELIGEKLTLSSCRLDGTHCCTFEVAGPRPTGTADPGDNAGNDTGNTES